MSQQALKKRSVFLFVRRVRTTLKCCVSCRSGLPKDSPRAATFYSAPRPQGAILNAECNGLNLPTRRPATLTQISDSSSVRLGTFVENYLRHLRQRTKSERIFVPGRCKDRTPLCIHPLPFERGWSMHWSTAITHRILAV